MKRLLYIVVLASLLAVPVRYLDVGNIMPVELLMVYTKNGVVEISTDTGSRGTGNSLWNAAKNLHESASEELFLDTARYLILAGEGLPSEELKSLLKPGISVCRGSRKIDLKEAVKYLSEHTPKCRLKDLKRGIIPPEIRETPNGFRLS